MPNVTYKKWNMIPIDDNASLTDHMLLNGIKRTTIAAVLGANIFTTVNITKDGILYFGDVDTSGSYRMRRDSTYPSLLLHQTRISETWTTQKITVLPSNDTSGATDIDNLNAASSNDNVTIELPGKYYVNGAWAISNDNLLICGGGSIKQKTANIETIYFSSSSGCIVENITLIGKGTDDGSLSGGLRFTNCNNMHIHKNTLLNHGAGGITYDGICNDIIIEGNTIIGVGSGTLVANCGIGYVSGGGTACDRLVISNNTIKDHYQGILGGPGNAHVISNNVIGPIFGQHGMYMSPNGETTISGNTIIDTNADGIKIVHSIPQVRPVTIVGNTVYNPGTLGINVHRPSGSGLRENAVISNNTVYGGTNSFYCSFQQGIRYQGNTSRRATYHGFYITNSNGTLSGNEVKEGDYAAIRIDNQVGDWSISNFDCVDTPINIATDSGQDSTCCIYISGTSAGNVFFDGVRMRFDNQSENSLGRAIRNANNSVLAFGTNIINETTASHYRLNASAMHAPSSIPVLSGYSKLAFHFDETGNNLVATAILSNGTSKTATIAFD